jgi:glycerol-3-phosphate acyltransferase PlsY
MAEITLVLLAAYLLGSIPTAVIVVRRVAGVDVRTLGDGNMGARNVSRTLGWKPATVVAFVDFFKGTLAVLLAQQADLAPTWQVAAPFAAALGHDFPVFAGFRGGQGLGRRLGRFWRLRRAQRCGGLHSMRCPLPSRAFPTRAPAWGSSSSLF